MSDYIAYKEEVSGLTIKIIQDEDCMNPYEDCDMFGTMVHWHRRGFIGTDWSRYDSDEIQERVDALAKEGALILPVYLYEHSGQTISCGPFGCPWDSGQVGFIYVEREKVLKEYGVKIMTKAVKEKALSALRGEIKTLDDYLTGNIYGFIIEDENGEELDSCWGFFGDYDGYCLEEARSLADWHVKDRLKSRYSKLKTLIKNRVPLNIRAERLAA